MQVNRWIKLWKGAWEKITVQNLATRRTDLVYAHIRIFLLFHDPPTTVNNLVGGELSTA